MFCVGVSEEEHCVHAQAESQEGNDLGRARVEGQTQEGAKSEAAGNCEGDQEDSGETERGLRSNHVAPTEQSESGVYKLKRKKSNNFTISRKNTRKQKHI